MESVMWLVKKIVQSSWRLYSSDLRRGILTETVSFTCKSKIDWAWNFFSGTGLGSFSEDLPQYHKKEQPCSHCNNVKNSFFAFMLVVYFTKTLSKITMRLSSCCLSNFWKSLKKLLTPFSSLSSSFNISHFEALWSYTIFLKICYNT